MTDQLSDITLNSSSSSSSSPSSTTTSSTIPAAPTTNSDQPPTNSDQPAPLSRNSSFSKLNAKAPEFVPMKPSQSPPPDPRLLIVPPPPPPPPAMVHVYPPTPMPVPIPVRGPPSLHTMHPHPHHYHHHSPPHHHHEPQPPPPQQQQHRQSNSNNNNNHHHHNNNNNNNNRQQKQYVSKEQQEGAGQNQDKDHGSIPSSRSNNNNGLTDEAAQKLINQVEYYFSDVNLATTDHLIKFIFKDPEAFVPVSVVASFKKIKALISSNSQLAAVLRSSTKLVVSEDGKKVKRLHPLTSSDMEELQARIVVAENLPEDHCHQNLMKIFSVVGSVKSIRTCQPQPANNGGSSASRSSKADNYQYNNKLHAFVEYDTVELADKAIAELNEDSWRNGLRVRPLVKQVLKASPGRAKKSGNEGDLNSEEVSASTSEQNQNEKSSESITVDPDTQAHEHGEEQSMDKEAGQKKSRNRPKAKGRGRGNNHNHNHHQSNRGSNAGGSHMSNGYSTAIGEQPVVAKQPPPGPRMPDGTRGFSMGRGRPLTVSTA